MISSDDDSLLGRWRTRGSRRRDGTGNDGETACALFHFIGLLLCLTEMKPRTRILLTWLYTLIIACVTGSLVARYHYSNEINAAPTDMRKLDISTTFCDSVTIESSSAIVTYKLYSEPEISNKYTLVYQRVSTTLGINEYQYWGFYLLEGSEITARVCGEVYMYKIVGKDQLDDWLDGTNRDGSDEGRILTGSCIPGIYYSAKVNETATKTDQYYFVFMNTGLSYGPPVNLRVDFQIRRKYYSLRGNRSTKMCMSTECMVSLSAQSSENVVLYVPDDITNEVSITIHCNPRVYMYVLIFGILPFLIGLFITCVIIKWSRKRNRDSSERLENNIFTVSNCENDRLQGYVNENFQFQMSPPSYEEVQALSSESCTEAPPSYEESVRRKESGAAAEN